MEQLKRFPGFLLLCLILPFGYQNCAPSHQFAEVKEETLSSETDEPGHTGEDTQGCVFNGLVVKDKEAVSAYQASSVPFGSNCISQKRVCVGGVLSGTYSFATCSVGTAASCLFNGKTIPHGSQVNAYPQSSVAFGQTCVAQVRTCQNGTLSGTSQFSVCSVGNASACLLNGRTIAHGSAVTAFSVSQVPVGSSCQSQTRLCSNGVLSGSYGHLACDVVPVCGSAHGALSMAKPEGSALCGMGSASTVSGVGTHSSPWKWSCNYNGQVHSCEQTPCSKISIKVRSTPPDTVNTPFRDIPFSGFSFSIDGQLVTIGGADSDPAISTYITSYSQFKDVMNNAYSMHPYAKDRIEVVNGAEFTWLGNLKGTEVIIKAKNGPVSFQSRGFWIISPHVATNGGYASSVQCIP